MNMMSKIDLIIEKIETAKTERLERQRYKLIDDALAAARELQAEKESTMQKISDIGREIEQEKMCVDCGKPTMHMGNKCYGCCQITQPEQEPVGCDCNQGQVCHICDPILPAPTQCELAELAELRLAYAECSKQRNELLSKLKSQPKRNWVGLTDNEFEWLETYGNQFNCGRMLRAIEVKLKEKNNG